MIGLVIFLCAVSGLLGLVLATRYAHRAQRRDAAECARKKREADDRYKMSWLTESQASTGRSISDLWSEVFRIKSELGMDDK